MSGVRPSSFCLVHVHTELLHQAPYHVEVCAVDRSEKGRISTGTGIVDVDTELLGQVSHWVKLPL